MRPERTFEEDGEDITSFEDHIQFYSVEHRAERASFLTGSRRTRRVDEVPRLSEPWDRHLSSLVARIQRAGSRAYAVDVTAPDIASAGLRVTKTVAPGLCALDVAHRARFLGSPRLLDASKRAMLTPRSFGIEDLNPLPHPFP